MRSPLDGPPPALPGPLDRVAERCARLAPRARLALVTTAILLLGTAQTARLDAAQARWGGEGERVWRASATVPAGQDPRGSLEGVRLPRAAIPTTAVTGQLPGGAVLAVALVEGAILTEVHLSPAGPAAALSADERLLPVPVERSWGIEEGSIVDVWGMLAEQPDPQPIATSRPVVQVREDRGSAVALVSLPAGDIAAATASLSRGGVLLTSRGG